MPSALQKNARSSSISIEGLIPETLTTGSAAEFECVHLKGNREAMLLDFLAGKGDIDCWHLTAEAPGFAVMGSKTGGI